MQRTWRIIELPLGKWCWKRRLSDSTTSVLGTFDSRDECEKSARDAGLLDENLERRAMPENGTKNSGLAGAHLGRRASPRNDRDRRQSA